MKKLLLFLLFLPSLLEAQSVRADRFTFNTGPCVLRSGSGSPETVVTGNICDTYWRTDTGQIYTKISGTGNTGWSTNGLTGSGTANTVAKWTGTTALGNSTTTDDGTTLTFAPGGDIFVNPTGNDVFPTTNYDINLGSPSQKFLSLHIGELFAETLVAQDVMATTGGRVLVAPTTLLTGDLSAGATTMTVKHNNLASGDRIYMQTSPAGVPQVEFMAVTSGAGGSAGAYTYSITRNLDGTGANQWYAGDAILNTGTTGNGFLDIYSTRGIKASTEVGPSIVGNVRNSSTYNDWSPAWAIGNLNGLYGYGATTFGAAFGNPSGPRATIDATNGVRLFAQSSATGTRVTLDATNGFRIYGSDNDAKVLIDTAGNATFDGNLTVGTGRNQVRNSDCHVGTEDWFVFTSTGLTTTLAGPWPIASGAYGLGNIDNDCYMNVVGTPVAATISGIFGGGSAGGAGAFPVTEGLTYEASGYLGVHRSGNTNVIIQWLNSVPAFISSSTGTTCTAAKAGGTALSDYCRSYVIAVAPAGATYARLVFQTSHTAEANPFVFVAHSYFGEASPVQEDPTPWGAAGLTSVSGGMIETEAIVTRTLAADSVTSAKIVAGTIVASDIAAATITGTNIAASTITASNLSVSTLSAISANMGTITAGTITGGTIDGALIHAGSGDEVTLNSTGITIANGTSGESQIKWTDSSAIGSNSGSIQVYAGSGVAELNASGEIQLISARGGTGHIYMTGSVPPQISNFVGLGGTRFVCHDNAGNLYSSGSTCDSSAPAPAPAALLEMIQELQAEVAALRAELRKQD